MPLYDYRCGSCGQDQERFSSHSAQLECLFCGSGSDMFRLPSLTRFHVVGVKPTEEINVGGLVRGTTKPITTNAELRVWQAANPNTRLIAKGSEEARNLKRAVRDRVDMNAAKNHNGASGGSVWEKVRRNDKTKRGVK